jgi:hypothetical protein
MDMLARLLRLASLVICLIAVAYFLTFVLNQTSTASNHQQAEVNAAGPASAQTTTSSSSSEEHESAFHEAVDEAFSKLASPFSGITAGSSSQWTIHIVDTLLVLLVYGFGLGFIARLLRIGQ